MFICIIGIVNQYIGTMHACWHTIVSHSSSIAEGLPDAEGGDQREPVRSKAEHGTPQQPELQLTADMELVAPQSIS